MQCMFKWFGLVVGVPGNIVIFDIIVIGISDIFVMVGVFIIGDVILPIVARISISIILAHFWIPDWFLHS